MRPRTADGVEEELRAAMRADDWGLAEVLAGELDRLDAPPRPVPVLGAALWYAQHGLHVFPLQPRGKKPMPGSRGLHDATTDAGQITAWFTAHPLANLGIATGHVVDVLDFDGLPGHTSWPFPTWEDAGAAVLATVSTPRPGGLHLYVPAVPGAGNRAGLYPGVDYRGTGGYVLAPPSVLDDRVLDHRTGKRQHPGTYRFLRPLHPEQL